MKKQDPYRNYQAAVRERLAAALSKLNASLSVDSFIPELNFLNQRGIKVKMISCQKTYSAEKQKMTVKLQIATEDRVQKTQKIIYFIYFNNEGYFCVTNQHGTSLSTAYNRPLYEEQVIDLIIADLMPSLTRSILGIQPIHEG